MRPGLVLWLLAALGALWTATWAFVLFHARPGPGFDLIEPVENRLRLRLLAVFGSLGLLAFALSLHAYPYPSFRARALGVPVDTIAVLGVQWGWSMSRDTVPARVPVEFVVRSKDVNHDFAVYAPDGTLLAQVQAMPGYANRLIYRFDRAGVYAVRCLEYCGILHHVMLTTFTVR
jgi:cytochrome c oxidase subunit 2